MCKTVEMLTQMDLSFWCLKFRAWEPANFLMAPAPDFFFKRLRLLIFFPKRLQLQLQVFFPERLRLRLQGAKQNQLRLLIIGSFLPPCIFIFGIAKKNFSSGVLRLNRAGEPVSEPEPLGKKVRSRSR